MLALLHADHAVSCVSANDYLGVAVLWKLHWEVCLLVGASGKQCNQIVTCNSCAVTYVIYCLPNMQTVYTV